RSESLDCDVRGGDGPHDIETVIVILGDYHILRGACLHFTTPSPVIVWAAEAPGLRSHIRSYGHINCLSLVTRIGPAVLRRVVSRRRLEDSMFFHTKQLQYQVRVDRPDPVYARKLQELIGGQFGEMTVMTQYLFQ